MKKIEALTLELAYADAASWFNCSVTQLNIEVVQVPSRGFLGLFKKPAIIVVTKHTGSVEEEPKVVKEVKAPKEEKKKPQKKAKKVEPVVKKEEKNQTVLNDTIMPASFVSDQDDEDEDLASGLDYTADYDDEYDEVEEESVEEIEKEEPTAIVVSTDMQAIANEVEEKINKLFTLTCFSIEKIEVSAYDAETLLIEFKGNDVALLIGKEGYRYKALSYMIFNWINSSYEVQLRLEIAEFLQNQEESMQRYLESVCENVERSGKAQTKILDGVLLQIALKNLREKYPQKYVVIRSTRDGLKYILIADYYN